MVTTLRLLENRLAQVFLSQEIIIEGFIMPEVEGWIYVTIKFKSKV